MPTSSIEVAARVDVRLPHDADALREERQRLLERYLPLIVPGPVKDSLSLDPGARPLLEWAADELREVASTVGDPSSPEAEAEMQAALREIHDRLLARG